MAWPATQSGSPPPQAAGAARAAENVAQGSFAIREDDAWLGTLLGSCVALCLRDPGTGIGGLNHFLLPHAGEGGDQASMRYGDYAIEVLINAIMKAGGDRRRFEAKIFGGAKLMRSYGVGVGESNIAFVRQFCLDEEITVVGEDVGGEWARKILYQPSTGRARVKKLQPDVNGTLAAREQGYRRMIGGGSAAGDSELFT